MRLHYRTEDLKIQKTDGKQVVLVGGWCICEDGTIPSVTLKVNNQYVGFEYEDVFRYDVIKKYDFTDKSLCCGYRLRCDYSDMIYSISLEAYDGEKNHIIEEISGKDLEKISFDNSILYCIDSFVFEPKDKTWTVKGWAYSYYDSEISFRLEDAYQNIKEIISLKRIKRADVYRAKIIPSANKKCGFELKFNDSSRLSSFLVLSDDYDTVRINLLHNYQSKLGFNRILNIPDKISHHGIMEFSRSVKESGIRDTLNKYIPEKSASVKYNQWFLHNRISRSELNKQKDISFSYNPVISIIVPAFNTPEKLLKQMIESVRKQSYKNWELCIADASDHGNKIRDLLAGYQAKDSRIRVRFLDENAGISGNTNKALEMATGEYTALLDHDDFLEKDALFEIVSRLQLKKYDVLYTDEDKYNETTKRYEEPNFKPDFSPEFLCSSNYITHFFIAKTEIIRKAGGFHSQFDGSQDYDLILRCCEQAGSICHIAKILYHWRIHEGSTAADPAAKMYCYEAGKNAIQAHYDRKNVPACVEMMPDGLWGQYHTQYIFKEEPLVSVIIAASNEQLTSDCIRSLLEINNYKNIEIIVSGFKELTDRISDEYPRVRTAECHNNSTLPDLYNEGFKLSHGDYVLFLEDSFKIIKEKSIFEMLGDVMLNHAGASGGKLLTEDDTVESAGITFNRYNFRKNISAGIDDDDFGFQMRAITKCNYSAVSGSCMLTDRKIFEKSGMFDPETGSCLYDVDFCLKLRKQGYDIVYNPFSQWKCISDESLLKYEKDEMDGSVYKSATNIFTSRWKNVLEAGDPFVNHNLTAEDSPVKL